MNEYIDYLIEQKQLQKEELIRCIANFLRLNGYLTETRLKEYLQKFQSSKTVVLASKEIQKKQLKEKENTPQEPKIKQEEALHQFTDLFSNIEKAQEKEQEKTKSSKTILLTKNNLAASPEFLAQIEALGKANFSEFLAYLSESEKDLSLAELEEEAKKALIQEGFTSRLEIKNFFEKQQKGLVVFIPKNEALGASQQETKRLVHENESQITKQILVGKWKTQQTTTDLISENSEKETIRISVEKIINQEKKETPPKQEME